MTGKDIPIVPPRPWLFEVPDWGDLDTMGLTVMLDPGSDDYGRASGIWWDEDSARRDGYRPPTPGADAPFYAQAAAAASVENFYNGPIPYPNEQGGPVIVGTVPLDHSIIDGERISAATLAERRWRMNADPRNGVLVGRIFADTVERRTGRRKGTMKTVYRFLGAVRHGATSDQLAMIQAGGLSGEWDGDGRSYGPVVVNRQGFPARYNGELARAAADTGDDYSCSLLGYCPPGPVKVIGECPTGACNMSGMDPARAATDIPPADTETSLDTTSGAESEASQRLRNSIDHLASMVTEAMAKLDTLATTVAAMESKVDAHDAFIAQGLEQETEALLNSTPPEAMLDKAELARRMDDMARRIEELAGRLNVETGPSSATSPSVLQS